MIIYSYGRSDLVAIYGRMEHEGMTGIGTFCSRDDFGRILVEYSEYTRDSEGIF
jgi:hypothetical protein